MKLHPVQSTSIQAIGFSTAARDSHPLVVVFRRGSKAHPGIHARTYYYPATLVDYRAIRDADSPGKELRARVDYHATRKPEVAS